MTPKELKNSILQWAVQGKLVEQRPEEGTAEELYQQIQTEKKRLIREKKMKKEKPLPEIGEDEKPFEIPEGWKWVRLGEISHTNIGLTYSPKDVVENGVIVLRSCNIREGKINYDDTVKVQMKIPDSKRCHIGDILICVRNGSKRLVGKAAVIDQEGMSFGAFMAIVQSLCNDYIFYVINSAFFRNSMLGDTGTTTINQITQEMLKKAIVPLPPLAEQKRIVAKIEELLPCIDRYEQAWSRLEELNRRFPVDMQKSILQMAIQGKLVAQRPGEIIGDSLSEFQGELPFEIPDNWKWVNFSDLVDMMSTGPFGRVLHKSDYIQDGIPIVNPANIVCGKLVASEKMMVSAETAKKLNTYLLRKGMVVMGRRGEMGRCAVVGEKEDGWLCGTGSFFMKPKPCLSAHYISIFFSSPYAKTYLCGESVGTTMSNLNHKILSKLPTPLPPLAEQKRIVDRLEELLPLCEKLKEI